MEGKEGGRKGLIGDRSVDGVGAGVCNPQVVHLYPGPIDGGGHAEGREGASGVGVGYWQEGEAEDCPTT